MLPIGIFFVILQKKRKGRMEKGEDFWKGEGRG